MIKTSTLEFRTFLLFVLLTVMPLASAIPPETEYRGELLHAGALNDGSFYIPIGFGFEFYDYTYNYLYISTEGLISFNSIVWNHWQEPIPSTETPNNYIAPFWDGLEIDASGDLMYQTVGTAPNRKLIIQYRNMAFEASTILTGTFQVILYEGSNNIQMQYRSVANVAAIRPRGATAVIGIENYTGTEGISVSYRTTGFVSNGKAALFTYNAGSYTLNADANYDPVVLTHTVPRAAPAELVSPAQGSTVGQTVHFEWENAAHAAAYNVIISSAWDLSAPIHTSADLTGYSYEYTLPVDQTYYWSVQPKNSEGISSWSSIRSFLTRAAPPLTAVPQTLYISQGATEEITLRATEGDGSSKTATIVTLPAEGTLYQDVGGFPGAAISAVPTVLSSDSHTLFYSADNTPGTGVGNFDFEFDDPLSAADTATITINVLPHGVPNFVYAAKATNRVELTFDRDMADPTGKHLEFEVRDNVLDLTSTSCQLKAGDPKTIVVYVSPAININNVVSVAYNRGTVLAESTGILESFDYQIADRRTQVITFAPLSDKLYGDPDFSLTASASSGLALRYESSDVNVVSLSGTTASINNLGESLITVTQDGNTTYAPARAEQVQRITKLPATITLSNLSQEYTGSGIGVTVVTDPPGLTVNLWYDGSLALPVDLGTYTVFAEVDDEDYGGSRSAELVIFDATDPVPDVSTLPLLTGECSVTPTAPTATDNYSGTITGVTTTTFPITTQGITVINWVYDDGNGNSVSQTQNVIVDDVSNPTTPTLADLNGECSVTAPAPTTVDNCAGTITGTTTNPLTYEVQGSYVIQWTFNDGNGNSIVVPQNVLVADVSDPVIPSLDDLTDDCSVSAGTPTTTDNCSGILTATTTDPLTYEAQGSYVIHWTFDDGNGNSIVVPQNVLVADVTDPVVPTLPDVSGECMATADIPTTTDACAGILVGSTRDALTYADQGTHVITWTFDDGHGNRIYVPQNVIVDDVTAPTATATGDVSTCDGTVSSIGLTGISDNCTTPVVTYELSGATTGSGTGDASVVIFEPGVTTVTFTLDDGNGNSNQYQLSVTHQVVDEVVVTQTDGTLTASAPSGGSFQWINCDGNTLIEGATSSSFIPTTSGEYAVILTQRGCSATSECYSVTISGLGDRLLNPDYKVYPNPAHDYVTVDMIQEQTNASIQVVDITGKLIQTVELERFTRTNLDISRFKEGMYFLHIRSDQINGVSRLVKE